MKKFIFLAVLLNCIVANAQSVAPVDGKLLESIQRLNEEQLKALVGSNDLVMQPAGPSTATQNVPVKPSKPKGCNNCVPVPAVGPLGCGDCSYGGDLQVWITKSGQKKLLQLDK